jgi:hypothetical protein
MLFWFSMQAYGADLLLQVMQPDQAPTTFVLCGVREDGASSVVVEVPGPRLLSYRLHVQARPTEPEGALQVELPWSVVARGEAAVAGEELLVVRPASVPAFPLQPGQTGRLVYPVDLDGAPYPQLELPTGGRRPEVLIPELELEITRLLPEASGCPR